jgi:hypothetical protein
VEEAEEAGCSGKRESGGSALKYGSRTNTHTVPLTEVALPRCVGADFADRCPTESVRPARYCTEQQHNVTAVKRCNGGGGGQEGKNERQPTIESERRNVPYSAIDCSGASECVRLRALV